MSYLFPTSYGNPNLRGPVALFLNDELLTDSFYGDYDCGPGSRITYLGKRYEIISIQWTGGCRPVAWFIKPFMYYI